MIRYCRIGLSRSDIMAVVTSLLGFPVVVPTHFRDLTYKDWSGFRPQMCCKFKSWTLFSSQKYGCSKLCEWIRAPVLPWHTSMCKYISIVTSFAGWNFFHSTIVYRNASTQSRSLEKHVNMSTADRINDWASLYLSESAGQEAGWSATSWLGQLLSPEANLSMAC